MRTQDVDVEPELLQLVESFLVLNRLVASEDATADPARGGDGRYEGHELRALVHHVPKPGQAIDQDDLEPDLLHAAYLGIFDDVVRQQRPGRQADERHGSFVVADVLVDRAHEAFLVEPLVEGGY